MRTAAVAEAGAAVAPKIIVVPGIIVIGAVCFNAALAVVNGNVVALGQAPVVATEVLFVAAAHVVALTNYRREMMPWYALLALFALFSVVRSLVSQTPDVKYLRDVMIIPTFVVLGMTFDARRLARVFVVIHSLMIAFLYWRCSTSIFLPTCSRYKLTTSIREAIASRPARQ